MNLNEAPAAIVAALAILGLVGGDAQRLCQGLDAFGHINRNFVLLNAIAQVAQCTCRVPAQFLLDAPVFGARSVAECQELPVAPFWGATLS